MASFSIPASLYMTHPVHRIAPSAHLSEAERTMRERNVSALVVAEPDGPLLGLVRRADLLRIGRREGGRRPEDANLTLPERPVSDEMSTDVIRVAPDTELEEVARRLVRGRTHRAVVVEGDRPVGIVTTRDLMRALDEKRLGVPVEAFMSSPVFTIRAEEPVSLAVERLERARVTGLVVVENGWPVGIFTEVEALESRDHPRSTPVEEVMSPRILALRSDTRLHRAAAQAAATRVRRVVVQDDGQLRGILTGLDFARAVAG
jgi:signal-transduction protein with cAMP-binding, CBS, and nucleotidyltransferase domain